MQTDARTLSHLSSGSGSLPFGSFLQLSSCFFFGLLLVFSFGPLVVVFDGLGEEFMIQSLLSAQPLVRVKLEEASEQVNRLLFTRVQFTLFFLTARCPQHNLLEREAFLSDRFNVRFEHTSMHGGHPLHLFLTKDGRYLNHGIDVVGTVEEGEPPTKQG